MTKQLVHIKLIQIDGNTHTMTIDVALILDAGILCFKDRHYTYGSIKGKEVTFHEAKLVNIE